ncbi:MAG: hypothetical protein E7Z76_06580 [Methanobrevibacter sp.]|nr:hypothetical protein [Methanobrevibacter sp.]
MDKNKVVIIVLIIIIIALAAFVGASFINNQKDNIKVFNNTIDGVGTFNSINVTNFTLSNSSNDQQTDYLANDSRAQISITSSSSAIDVTISEAEKVNDSAKGHTIYKSTANVGEYKGEIRYFTILKDNDKDRYIMISTDNHNLTSMIVDSFKMF